MTTYLGIVPPEKISNTVANIQNQFGDNRHEPHITLIPPITVAGREDWITTIEKVCSTTNPFTVHLHGTGIFGNRTLFIDVKSIEMAALHNQLNNAVKPFYERIGKQLDNRPFKPHLTLGRSWCGFTTEDFKKMRSLADTYVNNNNVVFTANFVRIYHKPDPKARYQTLKDVPLKEI